MSRSTQFQGHVAGVKTPRMLEVETRLGRTLEEDFAEYYVEKEWGQKKMSKRWGVTRTSIFGRYEKTTDLKSWVQVLQLPVGETLRHRPAKPSACLSVRSVEYLVFPLKARTGSQQQKAATQCLQTSSSSAPIATRS